MALGIKDDGHGSYKICWVIRPIGPNEIAIPRRLPLYNLIDGRRGAGMNTEFIACPLTAVGTKGHRMILRRSKRPWNFRAQNIVGEDQVGATSRSITKNNREIETAHIVIDHRPIVIRLRTPLRRDGICIALGTNRAVLDADILRRYRSI